MFLHFYYVLKMDLRYTWIYWQLKICHQNILLIWLIIDLIYWSVRSSIRSQGDGVKWVYRGYRCEYYFIRVHKDLVQHPSSYKSIAIGNQIKESSLLLILTRKTISINSAVIFSDAIEDRQLKVFFEDSLKQWAFSMLLTWTDYNSAMFQNIYIIYTYT